MIYKLKEGKNIKINDKILENLMRSLNLNKEEAIQVYLEDEGYEINEEQEALTKKAKENRITATIHQAEGKNKKREKRKVERKSNPDKEMIIKDFSEHLKSINAENIKVENIGKIITFEYNGKKFKLDLIETRVKKEV